MLTPGEERTVEIVVGELVKMHRTFTGRDVLDRIRRKGLRHLEKLSPIEHDKGVSKYVRYLFNSKSILFKDYGSANVLSSFGPVVFFPLPYHAKKFLTHVKENLTDSNGWVISSLSPQDQKRVDPLYYQPTDDPSSN